VPFPPPPPPPQQTECSSPRADAAGTWFSGVLFIKWGPKGAAALDECKAWCEQQIDDDCPLRMSVLGGHQVGCGFDATPSLSNGTCAVVSGPVLGVTTSVVASYHTTQSVGASSAAVGCYVDPYKVVPCNPDPTAACEISGANHTLAEMLCGELDPLWQPDCLFDYCVFGGNGSWVNITEIDGLVEDEETGRESPSPPSPSPPPSMPPPRASQQPAQCVTMSDGSTRCVSFPVSASLNQNDLRERARLYFGLAFK